MLRAQRCRDRVGRGEALQHGAQVALHPRGIRTRRFLVPGSGVEVAGEHAQPLTAPLAPARAPARRRAPARSRSLSPQRDGRPVGAGRSRRHRRVGSRSPHVSPHLRQSATARRQGLARRPCDPGRAPRPSATGHPAARTRPVRLTVAGPGGARGRYLNVWTALRLPTPVRAGARVAWLTTPVVGSFDEGTARCSSMSSA